MTCDLCRMDRADAPDGRYVGLIVDSNGKRRVCADCVGKVVGRVMEIMVPAVLPKGRWPDA